MTGRLGVGFLAIEPGNCLIEGRLVVRTTISLQGIDFINQLRHILSRQIIYRPPRRMGRKIDQRHVHYAVVVFKCVRQTFQRLNGQFHPRPAGSS